MGERERESEREREREREREIWIDDKIGRETERITESEIQ